MYKPNPIQHTQERYFDCDLYDYINFFTRVCVP